MPSFDLFLRLMADERYVGQLFGEISTVTQVNRFQGVLDVLLERRDLHERLLNGSDWPLPAINVVVRTRTVCSYDMITSAERDALNEIYDVNPLLFDFVLKRTLRHPETGAQFPASVFTAREF